MRNPTFEYDQLVVACDSESQYSCISAGRFELFLDLLYVAILSNFADTLVEDISGAKLAKYIVSVPLRSWQCIN